MAPTAATGSSRSKSTGASNRPRTVPETSHTAAASDGDEVRSPRNVSRTETAIT